jgi:phage tail tape-measure protein
MTELNVSLILQAVDRMSPAIARAAKAVSDLGERVRVASGGDLLGAAARNTGQHLGRVAEAAGQVGERLAWLGAGGGLLGGFVGTQIIGTAAQFEDYAATLKVLEGSAEGAQRALNWVSDFAAKTPFELDAVTEAYKKLRSYGLEPTGGMLKTLGDTASAMDKPLMQAVEAVADAVTGENERLKEFGITAHKQGGQITYEYTKKNGEQVRATVDASNRAQIQSTLQAIWNEKYEGAMEERSKTWNGMLSNLSDQWTRFANMLAQAGAFDFLKGELANLLATVDRMAADGSLQRLANDIGYGLRDAMVAAKNAAIGIWQALRQLTDPTTTIGGAIAWASEKFGGWNLALGAVAAVIAGPLIAAMAGLAASFVTLAAAMLATPIGVVVAGLATIVAGAIALYENWDWVTAQLGKVWAGLIADWNRLMTAFGDVGRTLGVMGSAPASAAPASAFKDGATPKFQGSIDITMSGAPAGTRVAGVKSSGGMDLSAELARGPSMVMP